MTSLTHIGVAYRNTALMTEGAAQRFHRMIAANPIFADAVLNEQRRAVSRKTGEVAERRYFVAYRPANPERLAELHAEFQAVQDQRGEDEWHNYQVRHTDRPGVFLTENLVNGKRYELHGRECSCEQWSFRLFQVPGATCKHHRVVQIHRALGMIQPAEKVIGAAR